MDRMQWKKTRHEKITDACVIQISRSWHQEMRKFSKSSISILIFFNKGSILNSIFIIVYYFKVSQFDHLSLIRCYFRFSPVPFCPVVEGVDSRADCVERWRKHAQRVALYCGDRKQGREKVGKEWRERGIKRENKREKKFCFWSRSYPPSHLSGGNLGHFSPSPWTIAQRICRWFSHAWNSFWRLSNSAE